MPGWLEALSPNSEESQRVHRTRNSPSSGPRRSRCPTACVYLHKHEVKEDTEASWREVVGGRRATTHGGSEHSNHTEAGGPRSRVDGQRYPALERDDYVALVGGSSWCWGERRGHQKGRACFAVAVSVLYAAAPQHPSFGSVLTVAIFLEVRFWAAWLRRGVWTIKCGSGSSAQASIDGLPHQRGGQRACPRPLGGRYELDIVEHIPVRC